MTTAPTRNLEREKQVSFSDFEMSSCHLENNLATVEVDHGISKIWTVCKLRPRKPGASSIAARGQLLDYYILVTVLPPAFGSTGLHL